MLTVGEAFTLVSQVLEHQTGLPFERGDWYAEARQKFPGTDDLPRTVLFEQSIDGWTVGICIVPQGGFGSLWGTVRFSVEFKKLSCCDVKDEDVLAMRLKGDGRGHGWIVVRLERVGDYGGDGQEIHFKVDVRTGDVLLFDPWE